MRTLFASLMFVVAAAGCGDDEVATGSVADCRSCVADDLNYTGAMCLEECLQDTYCYGPGNAAAPLCPLVLPPE